MRLINLRLAEGGVQDRLVRDPRRFPADEFSEAGERLKVLQGDLLDPGALPELSVHLDAAYYLVHSMSHAGNFADNEQTTARNFSSWIDRFQCPRIIYLSGLIPQDGSLSKHLASRKRVEEILGEGKARLTSLRASIIVGSGSASFEIWPKNCR